MGSIWGKRVLRTWPLPSGSVRTVVWLVAILAAGSCAAIEATISSGGDPAHFSDLRCLADGTAVAAATAGSEGALLRSSDGGLHWTLVKRGGELAGIRPNFVDDPLATDRGQGALRVTGYRSISPLQFDTRLGVALES